MLLKWLRKLQLKRFISTLNRLLPGHSLKKHAYLVAASWSGKSELIKLLVYRELIQKKPRSAVVVLDPHWDMAEEIARFQEFSQPHYAERLVYIDPALHSGYAPSINPFELNEKNEASIALMTQELLQIIRVLLQWNGQWVSTTNQMDAILSPCIAVLLRKGNSSFAELQRFMDDGNNAKLVESGMQSPNPQHRLLFRHKFNSPLFNATKHGIYTRMQVILNDPTFQSLISRNTTIHLKELIEQKKIILFKLSLGSTGSDSVQAYGRFIVGLLRVIALQRSWTPTHQRVPTYLFIDEFQNFVSGDLEKALTQLRKYGLHLILANQYVGQVPPSLQKALFASGVKIAGKNEKKSLSAISNEMDASIDDLNSLGTGQFIAKTETGKPQKLQTPKYLLGTRNAMKKNQWQKLMQKNKKHYYQKLIPEKNDSVKAEIEQTSLRHEWSAHLKNLDIKYHDWWN